MNLHLDFKLVRQGTRPVEEYRIKNEYSDSLRLSVNEYQFDFLEDTLVRFKNGVHENYKKQEFLLEKAEEIVKPYYFHAKASTNLKLFVVKSQV